MRKPQKPAKKSRINLYLDKELGNWIAKEAAKLRMHESAYARLLLVNAFNDNNNA